MRPTWILPVLAIRLAAQAPIPVEAPIQRVRLHPDEAWVTRVGRIKLAGAGLHRLAVSDLPAGLAMDDVRVSAKAPRGSSLGDLSLRTEPRKVTETPEYQALKKEWEAARDRGEALEAEKDAQAQELTFLKGIQATQDKALSERLSYTLPGAAAVVDLSKGIQTRLAELLTRDRRRQHELEKAREEATRLDNELRQRAAGRSSSPVSALVELSASMPGEVELELSYRTRQARWEPAYEARLAADGSRVELILFATVRQNTGEDWTDVQLEVTNTRASRSLTLSRFNGPQTVSYSDSNPYQEREETQRRSRKVSAAVVEVVATAAPSPSQNTYILDATPQEATPTEEAQGLASTWTLDGPKAVPADREPHRFRILSREVNPALALVAVPRLDPTVFRVSRFALPSGIPLFPGAPMVNYAGTQRLGQTTLELPAPGQPLQVGFGPFRGVRVALQRVEAKREQVGTFTKDNQWTLRERFEVSNDTDAPCAVELQDQWLVAASDKVKITSLPETTPAQEGPLPGVRSWTVKLGPKATGTVALATQIRTPAGGYVTGLGNLHLPE